MEIFAGFVEHTDIHVGKLLAGMNDLDYRDNTIVIYIFGDNGSSAEGQNGSISELLAQNQISNTIQQQIDALERIGGMDALGSPKTDKHVSCRMGLGRKHPLQKHQTGSGTFWSAQGIPWLFPGQIKSNRTRPFGNSFSM